MKYKYVIDVTLTNESHVKVYFDSMEEARKKLDMIAWHINSNNVNTLTLGTKGADEMIINDSHIICTKIRKVRCFG